MNLAAFYIFCIFAVLIYISFILFLNFHWIKYKNPGIVPEQSEVPFVSIIISGRNEEENIENCIDSILANDYPLEKYEIIYIDDESEDNSIGILKSINAMNFTWLRFKDIVDLPDTNNHKKEAINAGIKIAKGKIILQTDADTIVGKKWIISHASQYVQNKNLKLVTAPVIFKKGTSILEYFQYYDLLTTMGVTAAGIASKRFYMANGANMSYRKETYLNSVSESEYASGDDMFLIQETAVKYKESVLFLKNKNAVVTTYPEKTLKTLLRQRLRWATKTKAYKDKNLQFTVAFVFVVNLLVLINLLLFFFYGITQLIFFLILFLLKSFADSYFISNISKFFGKKINCFYLLLSLFWYPLYLVFIGTASFFTKKYYWKGRMVK